jgi:hypothetical protein
MTYYTRHAKDKTLKGVRSHVPLAKAKPQSTVKAKKKG